MGTVVEEGGGGEVVVEGAVRGAAGGAGARGGCEGIGRGGREQGKRGRGSG